MRNVSIFFMIVLVFPILFYSLHIAALYDSKGPLKTFSFPDSDIIEMARPSIILLGIYLAAFLVSIFLVIKKTYTVSVIFLSVMISLYILMNIFHFPRVY